MKENEKLKIKISSFESKILEDSEQIEIMEKSNLILTKEREHYKEINQSLENEIDFKLKNLSIIEGANIPINEENETIEKSFEKVIIHIFYLFYDTMIDNPNRRINY